MRTTADILDELEEHRAAMSQYEREVLTSLQAVLKSQGDIYDNQYQDLQDLMQDYL